MCIKAFRVDTKKKFFINLCHTSEIPAPKDITEAELMELVQTQTMSDFKVPLSVTKPRDGKDKAGNNAEISDVAINSEFYEKKIKIGDGFFFCFLITLIFESIEQKYKITLDTTNYATLKNRLVIDKLVEHTIYSRDVKTVEQFHDAQEQMVNIN